MNTHKRPSSEEYSKNLGEKSGLGKRVIDRLSPEQLDFYLQNKDNMRIISTDSNRISYIFTGIELILSYYLTRDKRIGFGGLKNIVFGSLTLNEQEFDRYLDLINNSPFNY